MKKVETKKVTTKKGIITVIVLGVLIISGVAYFAVVRTQLNKVGPGRDFDLLAVTASITQQQSYLDQLKTVNKNLESIDQKDLELLSSILPTGKAIPELISQLEVMARQSGVDLTSVNMSEQEESTQRTAQQRLQAEISQAAPLAVQQNVKKLALRVDINSFTYKRFRNFVEAIQTHSRLLDLRTFIFDTSSENQTLQIDTYYIPE